MFERATKTSWAKLRGAYGPALNVPKHLEVLAGADPSERAHAGDALRRELYAERRPSKAGLALAPLLLEAALDPIAPDRHRLVVLAVDLALGGHTAYLDRGVDRGDADIKKKLAKGAQKDGYRFLGGAVGTFRELLGDQDAAVRSAAALALAFHDGDATESTAALESALAKEESDDTRASLLVGLGLLAGYSGAGVPNACTKALAAKKKSPPLVRAAAAIGAYYGGRELTDAIADDLAASIALAGVGDDRFPFNEGVVDGHVIALLRSAGEPGRDALVEGLCSAIEQLLVADDPRSEALSHRWGQQLLRLALGRFEQKGGLADPADGDFCDAERELLARLSRTDSAIPFRDFGLPPRAAERRRLLGLDAPQVLDRRLDVEVGGKARSWPLWRLFSATQNGQLGKEALRASVDANIDPAERLDAMVAVSSLEYGLVGGLDLGWYDEALTQTDGVAWAKNAANALAKRTAERPPPARAVLLVLWPLTSSPLPERFDSLVPLALFDRDQQRARELLSTLPAKRREQALDAFLDMNAETMRVSIARPFLDLCPTERYAQLLVDLLVSPGRASVQGDAFADTLISMGEVAVGAVEAGLAASPKHAKELRRALKALKG